MCCRTCLQFLGDRPGVAAHPRGASTLSAGVHGRTMRWSASYGPHGRTRTRRSMFCWRSCRTSPGKGTQWTTTRRSIRQTSSILPTFSTGSRVSLARRISHAQYVHKVSGRTPLLPRIVHYLGGELFTSRRMWRRRRVLIATKTRLRDCHLDCAETEGPGTGRDGVHQVQGLA